MARYEGQLLATVEKLKPQQQKMPSSIFCNQDGEDADKSEDDDIDDDDYYDNDDDKNYNVAAEILKVDFLAQSKYNF